MLVVSHEELRSKVVEAIPKDSEEISCIPMMKAMGPLFKSPTFAILALSGAITTLGFFAPYAFVPGLILYQFWPTLYFFDLLSILVYPVLSLICNTIEHYPNLLQLQTKQ